MILKFKKNDLKAKVTAEERVLEMARRLQRMMVTKVARKMIP